MILKFSVHYLCHVRKSIIASNFIMGVNILVSFTFTCLAYSTLMLCYDLYATSLDAFVTYHQELSPRLPSEKDAVAPTLGLLSIPSKVRKHKLFAVSRPVASKP